MKKTVITCLFLWIYAIVSSQNTSRENFIKKVDSIVFSEVQFLKQKRFTEELVYLKDSTYNTYWDDDVTLCENQPIISYYSYNFRGELIEAISKNSPEEGCELEKTKHLLSYQNGNLAIFTTQYLENSSNLWINSHRYFYQYDGDNLINQIWQNWNAVLNVWENYNKQESLFNANNKLLSFNGYFWNTDTNNWFLSSKKRITYNLNTDILEVVFQIWSSTLSVWNTSFKRVFTYNASNKLTSDTYYSRDWNELVYEWNRIIKYEFVYDENDFEITRYSFVNWNNTANDWDSKTKTDNLNDTNGNAIIENIFIWNESENIWEYKYYHEQTFNVNNNITESISYNKLENDIWLKISKRNYEYDANLHQTERRYSLWNSDTLAWINNCRDTYNYNDWNVLIDHAFQDWSTFTNTWHTVYESHYLFDERRNLVYENSSSNLDYQDIYHYYSEHNITLNNNEYSSNSVYLYPNPSRNIIKIIGLEENNTVKIYDINGREISNCTNVSSINVDSLKKGVYVVKIKMNEKMRTLKFIKN